MRGLFSFLDKTKGDESGLNRNEAIYWLRHYIRDEGCRRFSWRDDNLRKSVYAHQLTLELMQRIRHSDEAPIEVVRRFYYEMDDLLCKSENRLTWAFAGTMENLIADILRYLRSKEGGSI